VGHDRSLARRAEHDQPFSDVIPAV
jgi:hypothetical protein